METKHLFLNPPHMFWAIEDTDIRLTRGEPFYKLSQKEVNELDDEQLRTLNLSLQAGTVTQINPEFIPENAAKTNIDFILSRRATEIQRKYVSRMIMAKDRESLNKLIEKERVKERPRSSVIKMVEHALKKIGRDDGGFFYDAIEELEDDLEGEAALPMEVADKESEPTPKPQRKRRGPRQRKNLEEKS